MSLKHVEKYSGPTKFDLAPQGTTWAAITDENDPAIWIQLSGEESSPNWQKWGDFLAVAFKDKVDDRKFIDECLKLYIK